MIKLHSKENRPPIEIHSINELKDILSEMASKATERLNLVVLETPNDNTLGIVLGSIETVLNFTYGHMDPPYYASKGKIRGRDPILTCYFYNRHHTEFPRMYVIPMIDGIKAVKEFFSSGQLPTCVAWEKV